MSHVRLAVTMGDPAGVGPEVVAAALREPFEGIHLFVVGPAPLVRGAAREGVEAVPLDVPAVQPGRPGPGSGRAAIAAVDLACEMALRGDVAGMVTAPVSKQHVAAAGVPFPGHTEYLAGRCGVRRPVMMFAGDRYRVSLVTTHVPVKRIAQVLNAELVTDVLRQTSEALRRFFGALEPNLAVCGLNPHAGEGGNFGREEIEIIEPAIEMARAEGVRCEGPFAADTIFRRAGFDGIVAMYHDQALPVVKTADPLAVNVTLGLPFVRTSPDHGTAFDIAGQGRADAAPMRRAIELAAQMARATKSLL